MRIELSVSSDGQIRLSLLQYPLRRCNNMHVADELPMSLANPQPRLGRDS